MQPIAKFLVFAALICFGQAEVKLTQGMNTTVEFEGEELSIRVDNPQKTIGELFLCLKSTSDIKLGACPEGYAVVHLYATQAVHTFQLNRLGLVSEIGARQPIGGNVVFESNGQLNLILGTITNAMTVTLQNAEIPVVTTTILAPVKIQTNSKATVTIICVAVVLVLLIFIIGALVLYFCWYKKRSNRPNATNSEAHQPLEEVRKPNKTQPQIATKSYVPPPPKRQTLMPSTTTSTTRASEDKPQIVVPAKPEPIASVASPSGCVSIIPASIQTSTPGAVSWQKSKRHLSMASKTTQSNKPTETSNLISNYSDEPVSTYHTESSIFKKQSSKRCSDAVSESNRSITRH